MALPKILMWKRYHESRAFSGHGALLLAVALLPRNEAGLFTTRFAPLSPRNEPGLFITRFARCVTPPVTLIGGVQQFAGHAPPWGRSPNQRASMVVRGSALPRLCSLRREHFE